MDTIKDSVSSWPMKISEYFIYVFLAFFPFISYKSFLYSGSSSRSANLILLAAIVGIFYAIWLMDKKNSLILPKSWILLATIVYFVSTVISALLGSNFDISFWSTAGRTTGLWYLINLGFVSWIFLSIFSNREKYKKAVLIVVLSTALFSLLAFLSPEGIGALFHGYKSEGFTFGNSTFAGMYIFGAFLLSLYYLFQAEMKKWWMYLLPIILIINPMIINSAVWSGNFSKGIIGEARTSSYTIALSLLCLFVVWLISKIKNVQLRSRVSYSVFGISIVVAIFCAYSLLSQGGYLQKIYLNQATAARPLLWEISGKVISQRPLFGWGTDNFERVYEKNYDNRLLQGEYGNEAWFDRAHNIFIDQATDNGIVGLALYISIYLTVILSLIYTALRSVEKRDRILASVLIVYFALHFLELQTAFDTSVSYLMLAFMVVSAAVLFQRTVVQVKNNPYEFRMNNVAKYFIAFVLILFFLWSLVFGWLPLVRAQMANGKIATVGDSAKRLTMYDTLLNSPVDKGAFLWKTSMDFKRAISENPGLIADHSKSENLKKELLAFENGYKDIIKDNPNHFRAHLDLADILIFERLFGVNKLSEAQQVLDEAIKLVPQSPQPYWMKAVAYLYMKKFDLAREYAKKALDINPRIVESSRVVEYIDVSIKNFPEIDLFFFKYI